MNIIDAWKKARIGDRIKARNSFVSWEKKASLEELDLHDFLKYAMSNLMVTADWEVERKPMVWEGTVDWETIDSNRIPFIERGDSILFRKITEDCKRTRIRIEEIIE